MFPDFIKNKDNILHGTCSITYCYYMFLVSPFLHPRSSTAFCITQPLCIPSVLQCLVGTEITSLAISPGSGWLNSPHSCMYSLTVCEALDSLLKGRLIKDTKPSEKWYLDYSSKLVTDFFENN